jgi:hypothetical protein
MVFVSPPQAIALSSSTALPMLRQGANPQKLALPASLIPANPTNPNGLTLADAEELHSRKWKTALMDVIPFVAPIKLVWDALFFNPSKAAVNREDFLHGERSYPSAILQEKRKKNAQLKAGVIPALLGISLELLIELIPALRNKDVLTRIAICSIPAVLTVLGYSLLENPKAKHFNEQF